MQPLRQDYSIFNDFNFERKPVGIKFLLNKPDGIERLGEGMPVCRMFGEAQKRQPFYAGKEDFTCAGRLVLGIMDPEPTTESGQIGEKEKIYQEARANRRIYQYIQKIPKGTVRYVAFSSLDQLSFNPDVVLFTATPSQAEILFRALSYSVGKPLTSKFTPVLVCAWIFAYPFMTGELNYIVTGIGYGFRTQKILPEGLFVISVPYDMLPMLVENLKEMEWVLPINKMSQEERKDFAARITSEIKQEYLNG